MAWCQENNIKVWGHTLCWHNQTPAWFFQRGFDADETRALTMVRLKTYIEAEVGRYKGKVYGWDVVNEAINDPVVARGPSNPGENLRHNAWEAAIGPDFIDLAFKFAHDANPGALLFYNDYGIEQGAVNNTGKHASSMALLRRLIRNGVPINGVGIEGHWNLGSSLADIDQAISDYESLGLKVSISELDLTAGVGNNGAGANSGGENGASPADLLQRQARFYAQLFAVFNKHASSISRVTFWGIDDARSWRRTQAPLLFDGELQPKPALQAVLDAASGKNAPAIP